MRLTATSPTPTRPFGREPLALLAHAVKPAAGVPSLLTRSAAPAVLACGASGKQHRDSSMKYSIALAAALAVFTLSACDRTPAVAPTVITVPGPAGAPGATGATGSSGNAGAPGETGAMGMTGASGATGTTGETGATGQRGRTGDDTLVIVPPPSR